MAGAIVDRKHQHPKHQTNSRCQRHTFASTGPVRTSYCFNLSLIDNFERRVIEVASFVRFRIEEETLGATFHFRIS